MSDFEIRPGCTDDHRLVYSATARSMRSSPYYEDMPPETYNAFFSAWVSARLQSPAWSLSVACVAEVPDEIAGFLLYRPGTPPAVGMVYVKDPYRLRGCAKLLLNTAGFRGGQRYPAVLGSPRRFELANGKRFYLRLSPYLF
jgi:hypothetical protein